MKECLSPTSYFSAALDYCLKLDKRLGAEGKQGMRTEICQSFSSLSVSLGVLILHSCRSLSEQVALSREILLSPFFHLRVC